MLDFILFKKCLNEVFSSNSAITYVAVADNLITKSLRVI
jgi:hypothetical protein